MANEQVYTKNIDDLMEYIMQPQQEGKKKNKKQKKRKGGAEEEEIATKVSSTGAKNAQSTQPNQSTSVN